MGPLFLRRAVPLGLALLAGCALSPKDDPSQFYILASSADGAPEAGGLQVLGLGPVTMPEYLRRPQMVTRTSEFGVALSEIDRWAEELVVGFSRVLQEELRRATGAARVRLFPWGVTRRIDYIVEVDVSRFEADPDGLVSLWAHWRVLDGETLTVLVRQDSRLTEQASGTTAEATVAAQSRAIRALATIMAPAIPSAVR